MSLLSINCRKTRNFSFPSLPDPNYHHPHTYKTTNNVLKGILIVDILVTIKMRKSCTFLAHCLFHIQCNNNYCCRYAIGQVAWFLWLNIYIWKWINCSSFNVMCNPNSEMALNFIKISALQKCSFFPFPFYKICLFNVYIVHTLLMRDS